MMRALVLRHEAAEDLQEAYGWYEQRREGLGSEFVAAAEQTMHAVLSLCGFLPVE